jgi:tripartite-type tricarboxylate transporter receptor subunit TctC
VFNALKIMCLVCLAVAQPALAAEETDYPLRPIRLIVPYPPGAGTDGTARIVADALSRQIGQSVIVENKPGATSIIGTDFVAKAPPDGYTLLWTATDSVTAVPALRNKTPYRVPEDFSYIAKVAETGMALVVASKIPLHSVRELIAYGKAHPGELTYGSSGIGSTPHLGVLLFEKYAGITMTHVPYKGVALGMTDLLGGQIDFALLTPITIVPFLDSGKLRVIGITSPARSPLLPNAPTLKEEGFPQATVTVWYGIFGPAKMPPSVLDRLRKEMAVVAALPAVKEKMAAVGLQMSPQFGDEFARASTAEFNQWAAIGKAEGLKIEE